MDYFLKANGLVILLWLFYYVFLRNETFFNAIRVYFLVGVFIIISIPLIEIPIYVEQVSTNLNWTIMEVNASNSAEVSNGLEWQQILGLLYISGVLFLSFKFLIQLISLGRILTSHNIIKHNGYKLVETDQNISPFSFFNFIIYNKTQFTKQELNQILNHEKTHVKQGHSVDTLLSYMLQIVFWFNPFAWMYKKATQQNLEFLVDNHVFKSSTMPTTYQHLLLKTSIPNYQMALANNFFNSFLKKRILMLHTKKSDRKSQWKFALILPLLMTFIFVLNTKTIAQKTGKVAPTATTITAEIHAMVFTNTSSNDDLENISKSFSEKGLKVEFKGVKRNNENEITAIKIDAKANNGKTSAAYAADDNEGINPIKIAFDSENNNLSIGSSNEKSSHGYAFSTKGKKKITKQKGEGKSFVFISDEDENSESTTTKVWVTKDGDTAKVKTKKIIIEIDEENEGEDENEEVYEVIIKEDIDDENSENKFLIRSNGQEEPIYFVNGKEISKKEMEKIEPENIESINVFKGKKAEEKYGKKGKNGVVEITLKKE